ncbi:MAG: hypothetical protein KDJ52_26780 [Anaerolineae bacterium]|nr:hypothetical protein [Anaerolineae bacterium]
MPHFAGPAAAYAGGVSRKIMILSLNIPDAIGLQVQHIWAVILYYLIGGV